MSSGQPAPLMSQTPLLTQPEPAAEGASNVKPARHVTRALPVPPFVSPSPPLPRAMRTLLIGQARPRTARRAPPKLASNEVKVQRAAPDMAPAAGVIMEGGAADDDESIMIVDQAGEAVDTSSMHATDSAEHGKLVRNLLDAKAEMEAQAADAAAPPEPSADAGAADGGIILGGKKERAGAGGGKMPTAAEITALRAKIQTLCQARADWDPRRAEMCAEVTCRDVRVTAARVRAEFEPSRPMPRVRARGPRRDGQGARAMARAPPAARHRARRGGEQDRALARVAPPGAGS